MKPHVKPKYNRKAAGFGRIKVRDYQGNKTSFLASNIRTIEDYGVSHIEGNKVPSTRIHLIGGKDSNGIKSCTVYASFEIVEALWDAALLGENIDLTPYSGSSSKAKHLPRLRFFNEEVNQDVCTKSINYKTAEKRQP